MNISDNKLLSQQIIEIINSLPRTDDGWYPFALLGGALNSSGIKYKDYGYTKLRQFINEFRDVLEIKDVQEADKPPVVFVRPRDSQVKYKDQVPSGDQAQFEGRPSTDDQRQFDGQIQQWKSRKVPTTAERKSFESSERIPTSSSWLFSWASIPNQSIEYLARLALSEKWYYGNATDAGDYPILKNYLAYTFRRLCFEKKIFFSNETTTGAEYAAFNTGLVDRKYEYIYALFEKNRFESPYWYLMSFAVAGEDSGKKLVTHFNPLPERADYFEDNIKNMFYDTSTGDLSCDYTHIITERTYRFPTEFLEDNCPTGFLTLKGLTVGHFPQDISEIQRKEYFQALGQKIKHDSRILNRLKNRIQDAVNLALKRTEWNYKTAIPMYFPTDNTCSLLLPLTLVDENKVDLALVVNRQPSGSYQGQTILPLKLAYMNSRLVCRPDSDWLRTDMVNTAESDDMDDSE